MTHKVCEPITSNVHRSLTNENRTYCISWHSNSNERSRDPTVDHVISWRDERSRDPTRDPTVGVMTQRVRLEQYISSSSQIRVHSFWGLIVTRLN